MLRTALIGLVAVSSSLAQTPTEVALRRDGTIEIAGKVSSYTSLARHVGKPGDAARGVLLRAPAELPLAAVQAVVDAYAQATHRRGRLWLAVGAEGQARPCRLPATEERKALPLPHRVTIRSNGAPSTLDGVLAELRVAAKNPQLQQRSANDPKTRQPMPLEILAPGDVPYSSAFAVLDQAVAAGFVDVSIDAKPTERQSAAWTAQRDLGELIAASGVRRGDALGYAFELAKLPAFQPGQWNSAVGLGGGAGGKFGGRWGGRRVLGRRGQGKVVAASIERGLKWLVAQQEDDGRWSVAQREEGDPEWRLGAAAIGDLGVTSLALLAFMGDGSTLRSGPFKPQVRSAVQWLRKQQDPATGSFIGTRSVVAHAVVTYAIIEAYGLSRYKILKKNAQLAVDQLMGLEPPKTAAEAAWFVLAARAARDFNLDVDDAAWEKLRIEDDASVKLRADSPSGAFTAAAAALFADVMHGGLSREDFDARAVRVAAVTPQPTVKLDRLDPLGWYFGSYALYQAGGVHWHMWSKTLSKVLPESQVAKGKDAGAWKFESVDTVATTALMTLSLQAYYRYTKIVR